MATLEPSIFDHRDLEADDRAVREGRADAEAGRVVPHEVFSAWLATWGTPDERPMPSEWFK